jgi:hypothetical protein
MFNSVKLEGVLRYRSQLTFDFVITKLLKDGYFDPVSQSVLAYGEPVGSVFDKIIVFPYATYPASLYSTLLYDQHLLDSTGWLLAAGDRVGEFITGEQITQIRFSIDTDWYKPILCRAEIPELIRPSYDLLIRLSSVYHVGRSSDEHIQQQDELAYLDDRLMYATRYDDTPIYDTIRTEYFRCLMHVKYRDIIAPTEKWLRRGGRVYARKLRERLLSRRSAGV